MRTLSLWSAEGAGHPNDYGATRITGRTVRPAWRGRRSVQLVTAVIAAAALASCGNAKVTVSTSGNSDGVSAHRVVVGGLASLTGPVTADFAPIFQGVAAYFGMVNAKGGVDGRKLDLAYQLDDQSDPAMDTTLARTLVDQDHVFAVVGVATPSFTGAGFLASHDVPTFGLDDNPNSQWAAGPSLFGEFGSYNTYSAPLLQAAFLAEQHHVTSAAVLAYDVTQSQQGCEGPLRALREYGIHISYTNLGIPVSATGLDAVVSDMAADHVDMVVSCMDISGNIQLANKMSQNGMRGVTQLWFDGYDQADVRAFAAQMQGVYLFLLHVPFEAAKGNAAVYPGLYDFRQMMARYEPGHHLSEAALAGWVNAALFVDGLRLAGRDLTRSRLVKAINTEVHHFSAHGIVASPVNWSIAHTAVAGPYNCGAFVQVEAGRFVPVYTTPATPSSPASVLSCFPKFPPASGPLFPLSRLPQGVPPFYMPAGT